MVRTVGWLLVASVVVPVACGFFGAMFADLRQWWAGR